MSEKELTEQIECLKMQLEHEGHRNAALYEKYKTVLDENEKLREAVIGLAMERYGK